MLKRFWSGGEKKSLTPKDAANYLVLLVSDDEPTCSTICDILREEGYSVQAASNIDAAVRLVGQQVPDVLIGDFMQPEVDGKELLKLVGIRLGKTAVPPVLFLMDSKEDETAARDLGAYDLLTKPVDTEALTAAIAKLIESQKSVDPK
jgi:DNA-binding response OmpR family regulator